ncbi:hypothetical protein IW262DRAFT_1494904 [Armillaria fumosa]|nr:hypothetical protein IW262DRAFT_1494904 [Armillaria fumosa]
MTLCPGYQQVAQFGPDDDYEEEEEEIFYPQTGKRRIGLDTRTPFLQLAGTVLKGRHEILLGTELLFSEHEDAVSYMESTRQRICFREVRLEEKGKAKAKADACQLVLDTLLVNSQLYHAGTGLERWRPSPRITDAIVHFEFLLVPLQLPTLSLHL